MKQFDVYAFCASQFLAEVGDNDVNEVIEDLYEGRPNSLTIYAWQPFENYEDDDIMELIDDLYNSTLKFLEYHKINVEKD